MEENRYEKALERAKSAIKECGDNVGRIKMIESIFPELKESAGEKIRKALIDYFEGWQTRAIDENAAYYKDIAIKDILAWLEKQGEEKSQSDSKKLSEQIKDFEGEFGCWNSAQDFRPKHLQRCLCYDKYMKGVYCYVYDDISKYWCTQTTEEHDPDGDNHICDYADYRVTVWMSLPDTSFYPSKTLLDKQGEQNLVDKVEQKFKVGD